VYHTRLPNDPRHGVVSIGAAPGCVWALLCAHALLKLAVAIRFALDNKNVRGRGACTTFKQAL
jgi:hypothetical protein